MSDQSSVTQQRVESSGVHSNPKANTQSRSFFMCLSNCVLRMNNAAYFNSMISEAG